MELSLNAVWLLLALSGLFLCAKHQVVSRKSRRDFVRALLASSILCVFLFPVISATDDLHPPTALIEESNSRKSIAGISAAPLSGLVGHSAVFLFLLTFVPLAVTFRRFGRTVELSESVTLPDSTTRHDERAPPPFARQSTT